MDRNANNIVHITTKVHPGESFLETPQTILKRPSRLRVNVFVSLPPLQPGYEVVSIASRVQLLKMALLDLPWRPLGADLQPCDSDCGSTRCGV
jgi:hypothetical protein